MTLTASANDGAVFSSMLTDNMVLQQNSVVTLWGYGQVDEKVFIEYSWTKSRSSAVCKNNGLWSVTVKTPKADFIPHSIILSSLKGSVRSLNNVVFGEVWLCSGQSNMEMILKNNPEYNMIIENSEEELASAHNTFIRQICINRKESFNIVEEPGTTGWKETSPENAKWFSAVAYFFAKKMYSELNVPVGIILSSYGGSPIQSWIPHETLEKNEIYKEVLADRENEMKASQQSRQEYYDSMVSWVSDAERKSASEKESCISSLELPVNLEKSKVGNQLGEVSFKRNINIDDSLSGKDLHISLGTIDDLGRVFFNGELIWEELTSSRSYSKAAVTVPADRIRKGTNTIEVKVLNILWGGGLTGPAEDMFYYFGDNSEKSSLAGIWAYTKMFDLSQAGSVPPEGLPVFSTAAALYNGMIYPLLRYKIKGVLWYQGEANISEADKYAEMFKDMVTAWRNGFKKNLPFYFVQIAPYQYESYCSSEAAELREAQSKAEETIPGSGMIVTMDLGDPTNIHPARKKEVGERLALRALEKTYGKKIASLNPTVRKTRVRGDIIELSFSNTYNGLVENGKEHEFEISTDGVTFYPSKIKITGKKILAFNQSVSSPRYVRYCWRDSAAGTIFNSVNLPLSSFMIKITPKTK